MFEDKSYEAHEDHKNLFDALQKSLERDYSNQLLAYLDEARRKKRKRRESPRTPPGSPPSQPPPPPPPAGASGKTAASALQSMAWTTSDTRYESVSISRAQELSPTNSLMHDDSIPDEQVYFSDDEDSENDHLPKADLRKDWRKPLPAEERHATPESAWTIPSSNICHSPLVPDGGLSQDAHRSDLEYLRYGSKGGSPALSIFNMKATRYPDLGLELLVPEQMWIDDVCTYDISAKYSISHWWFNQQKFYIDRHVSPSRQKEVRTHMRILSVVRLKAYSRYGYDYLSEIVLRRADFQEHMITKKDFKNLYPSDFEDLNLLLLQGHLDHLPGLDKRIIESYQTQLNLTKPGWDAKDYEFKHDYTIIESPRAVVFLVDDNDRKIMRFNEIYKFSDGTLTRILEALDYRVKEFKVKQLNPGMNTRFWTQKDVTRSKEFIAAIERRLKLRRIYRNLECFVGGRVRDIDYRFLQRTE
ncbi:hypothetical protein Tco_0313244 [Tanacetum coccineum]